jgi:hypothetical protein
MCAAGGAQSGRAAAAEKQLERMRAEGLIEKPFVPKRRSFTFPPVEKMGAKVVDIKVGTCGVVGKWRGGGGGHVFGSVLGACMQWTTRSLLWLRCAAGGADCWLPHMCLLRGSQVWVKLPLLRMML